jgi:hypothetical protein
MVQPDDPFERELRWIVHLQEEVRMHDRIANHVEKFGGNPQGFKEMGDLLRKFQKGVASALPSGYRELRGNPKVEEMLASVGQAQMYHVYTVLSAHVHGNHSSTWLYRRNIGTKKEIGELIDPTMWHLPLWTSWKCLQLLGQSILDSIDSRTVPFISSQRCAVIDKVFTHFC